jgi:hypothetical protein
VRGFIGQIEKVLTRINKMITMTYGTMPTREDFDFALVRENCESGFRFGNDPRVGTCTLTPNELWDELNKALTQYDQGDDDKPTEDYYDQDEYDRAGEAGRWCASVLETLGFEWV